MKNSFALPIISISEAEEEKLQRSFLPKREGVQLAVPATDLKVRKMGETVIIQPKLNGERCRIKWIKNKPHLISSYGNEFLFLEKIQEALMVFSKFEIPFDGEIYVHGWSRERIDSALRRKKNRNPDSFLLEYHIFDLQGYESSQAERVWTLLQIEKQGLFRHPIQYVSTFQASSETWDQHPSKFMNLGYEGIIIRNPTTYYTNKRRSTVMLKYKPTKTDKYIIIRAVEAISKTGTPKGMVGSFWVTGGDNSPFKVGAGKLKFPERKALWERKEELIGKFLLVKHEELTTSGNVPIAAIAVEVIE